MEEEVQQLCLLTSGQIKMLEACVDYCEMYGGCKAGIEEHQFAKAALRNAREGKSICYDAEKQRWHWY
jgi:hypothetical protein